MSNNEQLISRRICFLDYLRIFAFVSVLIGHKYLNYVVELANDATVHATPRFIANLLVPFFFGGGAGVVVFFLVSGYIITHVLQTEKPAEFAIKRIFRVYPLYIVAVITQYILSGNFPDFPTLAVQLLLVGDLFGAPYTLNGVEWTLRVEVVFYIFMGVLRWLTLLHEKKKYLPYILALMILLLRLVAPIPSANIWSKGYLTIYGPFLLLGAMFYLAEKRQIGFGFLLFFSVLVFFQYYSLIAVFQKNWLGAHFAMLAFLVFVVCWNFRKHISAPLWVLFISDLTYAVYLFHNWAFDYIKMMLVNVTPAGWGGITEILTLFVLLLLCSLMVRFVEKPGIRLGRILKAKILN